ncbi:hypothetical protein EMIT0324P_40347 [Pseudomonas chlororaphis]
MEGEAAEAAQVAGAVAVQAVAEEGLAPWSP